MIPAASRRLGRGDDQRVSPGSELKLSETRPAQVARVPARRYARDHQLRRAVIHAPREAGTLRGAGNRAREPDFVLGLPLNRKDVARLIGAAGRRRGAIQMEISPAAGPGVWLNAAPVASDRCLA